MDLWLDMLEHSGVVAAEGRPMYRAAFGRDFAAHGPAEVQGILSRAGFTAAACYQVALVRGWVAKRR